jgi:hypothetical protein
MAKTMHTAITIDSSPLLQPNEPTYQGIYGNLFAFLGDPQPVTFCPRFPDGQPGPQCLHSLRRKWRHTYLVALTQNPHPSALKVEAAQLDVG